MWPWFEAAEAGCQLRPEWAQRATILLPSYIESIMGNSQWARAVVKCDPADQAAILGQLWSSQPWSSLVSIGLAWSLLLYAGQYWFTCISPNTKLKQLVLVSISMSFVIFGLHLNIWF